jgi:hypothetical protein
LILRGAARARAHFIGGGLAAVRGCGATVDPVPPTHPWSQVDQSAGESSDYSGVGIDLLDVAVSGQSDSQSSNTNSPPIHCSGSCPNRSFWAIKGVLPFGATNEGKTKW